MAKSPKDILRPSKRDVSKIKGKSGHVYARSFRG